MKRAFDKRSLRAWLGACALVSLVAVAGCAASGSDEGSGLVIGGYGSDDSDVSEAVRNALRQQPQTARHDIEVTYDRGVVRLYGFVDTSGDKASAERTARSVDGVRTVHNALIVR